MDTPPNTLTVAEVRHASKGMLQQQLYAVDTRPSDGLGPVLKSLEEHLNFQMTLEREGILFAAGPIWNDDETEWDGTGMVIIRAESRAAAIATAQRDPMHRAGARNFTVRPWMVNEGTMTLRLDLSSQRLTLL